MIWSCPTNWVCAICAVLIYLDRQALLTACAILSSGYCEIRRHILSNCLVESDEAKDWAWMNSEKYYTWTKKSNTPHTSTHMNRYIQTQLLHNDNWQPFLKIPIDITGCPYGGRNQIKDFSSSLYQSTKLEFPSWNELIMYSTQWNLLWGRWFAWDCGWVEATGPQLLWGHVGSVEYNQFSNFYMPYRWHYKPWGTRSYLLCILLYVCRGQTFFLKLL